MGGFRIASIRGLRRRLGALECSSSPAGRLLDKALRLEDEKLIDQAMAALEELDVQAREQVRETILDWLFGEHSSDLIDLPAASPALH